MARRHLGSNHLLGVDKSLSLSDTFFSVRERCVAEENICLRYTGAASTKWPPGCRMTT